MIDIIKVKYAKNYKLELIFEDGTRGVVNLQDYLNQGGVFSRFSNLTYFKKVYVNKELGTICWPDGLDIAPETLYQSVTGKRFQSKNRKAA